MIFNIQSLVIDAGDMALKLGMRQRNPGVEDVMGLKWISEMTLDKGLPSGGFLFRNPLQSFANRPLFYNLVRLTPTS